ncbi:MAG: hypothetical protein AAFN77_22705 [Planctomycetota bacterium]
MHQHVVTPYLNRYFKTTCPSRHAVSDTFISKRLIGRPECESAENRGFYRLCGPDSDVGKTVDAGPATQKWPVISFDSIIKNVGGLVLSEIQRVD